MPVRRITILEPAPCADTLLEIRQDRDEGYLAAGESTIWLRSGSRLRPRLMGTYAGGKATNVARVMDVLLGPEDDVLIELIVFRPDSPEGRYIAELQSAELSRVQVRSVVVDSTARFCLNLSDPLSFNSSAPVEFNISPRIVWQPSAEATAIQIARELRSDLLVLAGNPPANETGSKVLAGLPAAMLSAATGLLHASVDIGDGPLALILNGRHPDVIKINDEEYASVDPTAWARYTGILVVTDAAGCNVWEKGPGGLCVRVPAVAVHNVYSTVGAGDAAHAAFTLASWVWGYDPVRAARYSMAAAAAAVSNPVGTRGITKAAVDKYFRESEGTASS